MAVERKEVKAEKQEIRDGSSKRVTRSQRRDFFIMDIDYSRSDAPGLKLLNEEKLMDGRRTISFEDVRVRGFPPFPEKPVFLFDRKLGLTVRDVEIYDFWLVSERAKAVFETVDPDAFAFLDCEVRLSTGEEGPKYWYCDVIKTIDAIDEATSVLTKKIDRFGRKFFPVSSKSKISIDADAVGSSHVFRAECLNRYVLCDIAMRNACGRAGISGLQFRSVMHP